ncbi:MAG: phage holin family protein, partial [Agromyces sp.]
MTAESKSLFTLIGELPEVISRLVSAEIQRIKVELSTKAKNIGVGVAFLAAAALVAVFLLGTLIATVILVLALWLPAWAAALITSGLLILVIALLALLGLRKFQRAGEDVGLGDDLRRDVDAFKGV